MNRIIIPADVEEMATLAVDAAFSVHTEIGPGLLETAYEGGNPDLIELNSEPVFDWLRADSKFKNLMHRIGWDA